MSFFSLDMTTEYVLITKMSQSTFTSTSLEIVCIVAGAAVTLWLGASLFLLFIGESEESTFFHLPGILFEGISVLSIPALLLRWLGGNGLHSLHPNSRRL